MVRLGGCATPSTVREGEAQAFHIGMTWRNLRLDVRDFPAATPDSCRDSQSRRFDLFEGLPVGLQRGVLTAAVMKGLSQKLGTGPVPMHKGALAASHRLQREAGSSQSQTRE